MGLLVCFQCVTVQAYLSEPNKLHPIKACDQFVRSINTTGIIERSGNNSTNTSQDNFTEDSFKVRFVSFELIFVSVRCEIQSNKSGELFQKHVTDKIIKIRFLQKSTSFSNTKLK